MSPAVRFAAALLALALAGVRPAHSAPPQRAAPRLDYARDVRPILQARCFSCHGPKKQRGDLRLDRKADALRGGQSGPAVVPGKGAASLLVQRARSDKPRERMPPSGDRLTAKEIQALAAWVDQGAPWDEKADDDPRDRHWAFQPVARPPVPDAGAGWARTPIDRFLAARLAQAGLVPSPEAPRVALIRRLSFDLTGLPPAPEEVQAFLADRRADAYERLVDRRLASPAFGERQARHWLDVVRFAETTGFETNASRPNAWPYRDWVIRAFNDDRPYDEFVRDQLAGDATGEGAATGLLVGGAFDQVKGDPTLNAQQRADELQDMVATTGAAFLGLTVGCARCHDHKFDPVSHVDYHAMKAVFAGVQHGERPVPLGDARRRRQQADDARRELAAVSARLAGLEPRAGAPGARRAGVSPLKNVERLDPVEAKFIRMTVQETNSGSEPCLDELEVFVGGRNVALASHGTKATASGTYPNSDIHRLEHVNDGRYGNGRSWISNEAGRGWVQLELPAVARVDRIVWARDRQGAFRDRLATRYRIEVAVRAGEWRTVASSDDRQPPGRPAQLADGDQQARYRALAGRERELEQSLAALSGPPMVYAGRFTAPEPTHRLLRGEVLQKGEAVAPGTLAKFPGVVRLPLGAAEQGRRVGLARWVASPRHPLTARVMANRVWQQHFGQGLVSTPSDFGLNGARPSHPELLDWLADELVRSGWSLKHLHRVILLSAAYRQASAASEAGLAADAGSRLLWRYPPRRLEAEAIRDAILAVSGRLDRAMGGPGFDLFEARGNTGQGVKVYVAKKAFGPAEWRRMVYQSKPRMRLDDTFGAFDCPDAGQPAPARTASTTPLQALNLLNSPFLHQQAALFAGRLEGEAGGLREQVRRGYWLAYQRAPADDEIADGVELARGHGLKVFCLGLLNTSEFLYLD